MKTFRITYLIDNPDGTTRGIPVVVQAESKLDAIKRICVVNVDYCIKEVNKRFTKTETTNFIRNYIGD